MLEICMDTIILYYKLSLYVRPKSSGESFWTLFYIMKFILSFHLRQVRERKITFANLLLNKDDISNYVHRQRKMFPRKALSEDPMHMNWTTFIDDVVKLKVRNYEHYGDSSLLKINNAQKL